MRIEIGVINDEAGDDMRSLAAWLREDEDLRPSTFQDLQNAGRPSEMGPVTDLLQVVGAPEVIAALIGSITGWLTTRTRVVKVRLRKGDVEVEIEGSSVDDSQKLATELMSRLDGS